MFILTLRYRDKIYCHVTAYIDFTAVSLLPTLTGDYLLKNLTCRFNPNLDGGVKFILPCWFSLNNSETLKAVVLLICNVQ